MASLSIFIRFLTSCNPTLSSAQVPVTHPFFDITHEERDDVLSDDSESFANFQNHSSWDHDCFGPTHSFLDVMLQSIPKSGVWAHPFYDSLTSTDKDEDPFDCDTTSAWHGDIVPNIAFVGVVDMNAYVRTCKPSANSILSKLLMRRREASIFRTCH